MTSADVAAIAAASTGDTDAASGSAIGSDSTPATLAALVPALLAAMLAEFISRLVGFCASIVFARSFFFGPRVLFPSVEPAARAMFSGIWSLGWLVVSLVIAGILGAIGAILYARRK